MLAAYLRGRACQFKPLQYLGFCLRFLPSFNILFFFKFTLYGHFTVSFISLFIVKLISLSLAGDAELTHILTLPLSDNISLCNPGWPRTCCIDQDGLELRETPASASSMLG